MKTLKDLAGLYKTSALNAINPGVPYSGYKTGVSKAYKSGNLYRQVDNKNTAQSIIKKDKDSESFTLILNIAPGGAEYGKYVHSGTRSMSKRPFAELAAENPEFKQQLNNYMQNVVENKLSEYFEVISKDFEKAGITAQ